MRLKPWLGKCGLSAWIWGTYDLPPLVGMFFFTIPVFVWVIYHPSKLYKGCRKLLPIEILFLPLSSSGSNDQTLCAALPPGWESCKSLTLALFTESLQRFSAFIKTPVRLNCPTVKVDEWILCVTPLQVVAINSGSNWQMFVPWRRTLRPCVLHRSRGFITMPLGSGHNVTGGKYSILFCLAAILGCKCECWRRSGLKTLCWRSGAPTRLKGCYMQMFYQRSFLCLPCSWSGV